MTGVGYHLSRSVLAQLRGKEWIQLALFYHITGRGAKKLPISVSDIDHLSDKAAGWWGGIAGWGQTGADAGVDTSRHFDDSNGVGRIHGCLNHGIAGRRPAAVAATRTPAPPAR